MDLATIVSELKARRTQVDTAINQLQQLSGNSDQATDGHKMSAAARQRISMAMKQKWAKRHAGKRRKMSLAARRKIAAAQRKRWAIQKKEAAKKAKGKPIKKSMPIAA